MRRNIRERFNDRSLLFVIMMVIGINMFVFVLLYVIDRLLLGHHLEAGIVSGVIAVLFIIPYAMIVSSRKGKRRLTQIVKDDLFLFFFSSSFTIVGLVLLVNYLLEALR